MRVDFDPGTVNPDAFYRLLTAVVVPRPIAWVSTLSADGVANLAPHSFYTVASTEPPVVQFTSVGVKDTLRNVLATEEFVVNLAAEEQFAAVNDTATGFPPGLGEFEAVGIAPEPSATVGPPRVAGSPVAIECGLHDTVAIGTCTVVFGRVRHVAVAEEVLDGRGHPVLDRLRPLSRLGGNEWGATSVVRDRRRIRYEDWRAGARTAP
ncbi:MULTISPECIES: flavin reductase family protein [Streptomyces]|uniref:Flavin reductase family protein n=1 Tax=Streptomyces chilikensis TaxID=1194079 RepID=A0ABV3EY85_9ACTN|nr:MULTISPECIES: flavin reductase family protein [Streptomyces]MDH6224885.1 flavin reductase (DIM6/NTAB) family NADH-FMN oxidoreductase RutF [Streptomyces sp. MJP52]